MIIIALTFLVGMLSLLTIYLFPEFYKKVLYILFFSDLFIVIVINPTELYASAYISIFLTFSLVIMILVHRKIKIDYVTIFMMWFFVNSLMSWGLSYVITNFRLITYPCTAFAVYFMLSRLSDQKTIRFFVSVLIASVFLEAVIGISQSFIGFPVFPHIVDELYTHDRNYLAYIIPSISSLVNQGSGTFEHFNGLGGFLSLTVPIIWGYWLSNKSDKPRFIILLIAVLGVITTYSRGALLGSIIGIIFIYLYRSNVSKTKIFRNLLIISVLIILVGGSIIQNYYQSTENFSSRFDTWSFAMDIALRNFDKLIFGYGVFFFRENFLGLAESLTDLHSGQLQIFLELGIVGFILFMILFIKAIKKAVKENNILKLSLAGGVLAFFFHQLLDNAIFSFTGILMFGIIGIINSDISLKSFEKIWSHNYKENIEPIGNI